jgi:hypothetical protein
MPNTITSSTELQGFVYEVVNQTSVTDMHTHLYSPAFGNLLAWGIDELLTYHYLIAETMRHSSYSYEKFWSLSQSEKANHVWKTLFLDHSPYSEACRGVLTSLQSVDLDLSSRDLDSYRKWYSTLSVNEAVDLFFKRANVKSVVMTNDPFDQTEQRLWLSDQADTLKSDERFHAALRIDPLLNDWNQAYRELQRLGYDVQEEFIAEGGRSLAEVQRFLRDWAKRMNALYMAVSLPIDFSFPGEDTRSYIIENAVLPVCRELNIPFAMMIGVKRQANPLLRSAGDMGGRADITAVERICSRYPDNRFMVTMLSRENQHDLAVLARKFRNLMVFGCWWFLNNPSLVQEITQMRFELLGTSFIPQQSDARILDQLPYKWSHYRSSMASVLYQKYNDVLSTGWQLEKDEILRDVNNLLNDNFWRFVKGRKS